MSFPDKRCKNQRGFDFQRYGRMYRDNIPTWCTGWRAVISQIQGYKRGLDAFFAESGQVIASDTVKETASYKLMHCGVDRDDVTECFRQWRFCSKLHSKLCGVERTLQRVSFPKVPKAEL